jgi:hypothetical protein
MSRQRNCAVTKKIAARSGGASLWKQLRNPRHQRGNRKQTKTWYVRPLNRGSWKNGVDKVGYFGALTRQGVNGARASHEIP